jgi:hypothetical protein
VPISLMQRHVQWLQVGNSYIVISGIIKFHYWLNDACGHCLCTVYSREI